VYNNIKLDEVVLESWNRIIIFESWCS